jgi:hypothetical protein
MVIRRFDKALFSMTPEEVIAESSKAACVAVVAQDIPPG